MRKDDCISASDDDNNFVFSGYHFHSVINRVKHKVTEAHIKYLNNHLKTLEGIAIVEQHLHDSNNLYYGEHELGNVSLSIQGNDLMYGVNVGSKVDDTGNVTVNIRTDILKHDNLITALKKRRKIVNTRASELIAMIDKWEGIK